MLALITKQEHTALPVAAVDVFIIDTSVDILTTLLIEEFLILIVNSLFYCV
jgi:hypothetical protein